jgi:UPF0716 family protein affecting phage T7 exclusion
MKSVGFSAFLHLKNLMQESNTPKEYIIGQGVTALSGILLMLPGFLSDGVFVLVTIFKTVIVNQIAKKFNLQMMQATFTQKGGQTEVKGRIIDQQ